MSFMFRESKVKEGFPSGKVVERHSPRGVVMEEPSLKVAKWTDWFNLLER